MDEAVSADLQRLEAIGPGEVTIDTRILDDRTGIVAYSAAESPLVYYRYDRGEGGQGELTRRFSGRPALDDQPRVPQWPVEIGSRNGKTLDSHFTLPVHTDADRDGKPDTVTTEDNPRRAELAPLLPLRSPSSRASSALRTGTPAISHCAI